MLFRSNLYVGLWKGPTEEQLAALKSAGMKCVCYQNETGLAHIDDETIVAWMHGDEPDNAQSLGSGKGYGPPILPEKIIADYERIRKADPSRPVFLNLGQGVAWDDYVGRGVRRNHPEDYAEYVKGGDIVSFDIYPVAHSKPEVKGNLWYVPHGVERLRGWAGPKRVVWNCIETTNISADTKATPTQMRSEVWMSLIHGSKGIIYFVHQFRPKSNEHALLDDPEMLAAVTDLNAQITRLAPVLNTPPDSQAAKAASSNAEVPVDISSHRVKNDLYVFAAAMRGNSTTARFTMKGFKSGTVEVIDEGRTIKVAGGAFDDAFEPWGVHLYRISSK